MLPKFVKIDRTRAVNIDFFDHFLEFVWSRVLAQHGKEPTQVIRRNSIFFYVVHENVESRLELIKFKKI